jgi:nitronate monooxygenase
MQTKFNKLVSVKFPIIMAPMFLVSNQAMIQAAMNAGILGVFPTLNFRNGVALENILTQLTLFKESGCSGNYGVNLIVQQSNPLYEKHLAICMAHKVPFYITSLGNPKKVIESAHSYGGKVFCDVTNIVHAQKAFDVGCDGFIAVGQGAGGHAGANPLNILIETLQQKFDKPVIAAGGIATGTGICSTLCMGAEAVSIGTRFIASKEATVSDAYKNAIVDAGMDDIVLTERLSGTPCNVINTPYARKIGYKQNAFERILNSNKTTKKYFKMLVQMRGLKKLEAAVKPGNYNNLWCAGQSVELVNDILPVAEIVDTLVRETQEAFQRLQQKVG